MTDDTAAIPRDEAGMLAEGIVDTIRQPILILSEDLRVRSANRAFYETFQVERAQTEGHLIYELGNRQWDIPRLHELLSEILPRDATVDDSRSSTTSKPSAKRSCWSAPASCRVPVIDHP